MSKFKALESGAVAEELEAIFEKYDPKDHSDLAATLFCTLGVGIKKMYGDEGINMCLDEIDMHSGAIPNKETMN